MSRLLDWLAFWINAAACVLNLFIYAEFNTGSSLACAAFSGFVAIACKPEREDDGR